MVTPKSNSIPSIHSFVSLTQIRLKGSRVKLRVHRLNLHRDRVDSKDDQAPDLERITAYAGGDPPPADLVACREGAEGLHAGEGRSLELGGDVDLFAWVGELTELFFSCGRKEG